MTQVSRVLPIWYDVTPRPKRVMPHRGFSDRRHGRGGKPRLTDDQVRAIRLAGDWRWPIKLVAGLFHIKPGYCRVVMNGESHAHVR